MRFQEKAEAMEAGWRNAADTIWSQASSIKRLAEQNRKLWQREADISERIATIKERGYKPHKLLVNIIYRQHVLFPSVPIDTLFAIARKETSYGSNIKTGMLGEEGWSQFTEATVRDMILFFEGDTSGFRMSDYSDIITSTEWTYVAFIIARIKKRKNNPVSWADWNTNLLNRKRGGKNETHKTSPNGGAGRKKNNETH